MDAQVAVGRFGDHFQLVERELRTDRKRADDGQPGAIVNEPIEIGGACRRSDGSWSEALVRSRRAAAERLPAMFPPDDETERHVRSFEAGHGYTLYCKELCCQAAEAAEHAKGGL